MKTLLLALAGLLILPAAALAANPPVNVCDPVSGQCASVNSSGQLSVTGAAGGGGTTGSPGFSYSANRPALPNVGTNFAASGPYASYVLVATVPASTTRLNVDVENTSGAQIAVVRDDGTAASGSAPANAAVFSLAGGSGAGSQGGSWSSTTFKGRLQIYAPASTAQVAILAE